MNRMLIKIIIDIHLQPKITSFSIASIEYQVDKWRKYWTGPCALFSLQHRLCYPQDDPYAKIYIVLQMVQCAISFVNLLVSVCLMYELFFSSRLQMDQIVRKLTK